MRQFLIAARTFIVLTIFTGILYPLAVTAVAQVAFKQEANGSMIIADGRVVGSRLIGQPFDDPRYFWSRPSATSPVPYNAAASGGSNLASTNPMLKDAIAARIRTLREVDPSQAGPVPTDLVTASASGLDPDISVEAAEYQVARVAARRGRSPGEVKALIKKHTHLPDFGVLGEPRVNVLELNLELDRG